MINVLMDIFWIVTSFGLLISVCAFVLHQDGNAKTMKTIKISMTSFMVMAVLWLVAAYCLFGPEFFLGLL